MECKKKISSTDASTEMTEKLEFSDKDFKAVITKNTSTIN